MKMNTIQNIDLIVKSKNEPYDIKKSDCFPNIRKPPPIIDNIRRKSSEGVYKAKLEARMVKKAALNNSRISPMRKVDRYINI